MKIEEINNKILNEKIYFGTHDSGLRLYVIPKKEFSEQYAIFAAHYGSIDNRFKAPEDEEYTRVPDGIAHFLEHKLFEQEYGNVFEKFSKLGGFPNAFTNYNTTAYLFSSTDRFIENFELLVSFVQSPYLTDEGVEKEKKIIEQEIKMYEDNPDSRVLTNLLKCLYINNPINIDIAGTVESIREINKNMLYKCYNTFYHPSNMVIFAVGNVNHNEIFDLVERKINKQYKGKIIRGDFNEPDEIKQNYIEHKLPVGIAQFNIGFKDTNVGLKGKELLKKILLNNIILDIMFGKSSEFYNLLYSEGFINDKFGAEFIGEERYCFTLIEGESKDPNLVKEKVLQEINKYSKNKLNKDTFTRIKRKNIGRFIRQFDNIENIAYHFINYIFNDIMIFDYLEVLNELNYEEACEGINMFDAKKMAISVISPV